jgi:hypothetical protein
LHSWVKGSGTVEAHFNRITAQLDDPAQEAVLPYQWAPGLRVGAPAEIFPFEAGPGVTLIGVRPHGQKEVVVRY